MDGQRRVKHLAEQEQLQPPLPSPTPKWLCPGPGLNWVVSVDLWGRPVSSALLSPSQHTEPWLKSDKSYERKRVVQSIFLLLKYVLDCVVLTVSLLTAPHLREGGQAGRPEQRGGREPL